jgi:hypothetical protein
VQAPWLFFIAMPRKRRKPTRRGKPLPWDAVHPTLDLHGATAEEARARADRWLRAQQGAGERVVRLITGRGLHSVGPPVLPGEIQDLLASLHGSVVERFAPEGGGGAFQVELRKRKTPPRPRSASPDAHLPGDSELRRRAEESLHELGVEPTPALLRAEMRRLLEERRGAD